MQSPLKTLAAGATVAMVAAALLIEPAAASPASQSPAAHSSPSILAPPTLVLSMYTQNTPPTPGSRTLGCDDPANASGSHPRAAQACAALAVAGGNFANLRRTGASCPMIYAPVTATAHGRYKGKRVNFRTTYANLCVAGADSDDVFSW
ncbi:MAG: SSI family serine proteinase inhibitor [Kibdelosporangium sp.]